MILSHWHRAKKRDEWPVTLPRFATGKYDDLPYDRSQHFI